MTPEEVRAPVNPVEWAVCSAVAPLLKAAGVPDPRGQAPQVLGYLHRFGFAVSFRGDPVDAVTADRYLAMALDTTIVQGHGGPRTCAAGTRRSRAAPPAAPCRPAPGPHRTAGVALVPPCPTRVARPPLTTRSQQ